MVLLNARLNNGLSSLEGLASKSCMKTWFPKTQTISNFKFPYAVKILTRYFPLQFSLFKAFVRYHVIHHAALKYAEKITIVCLISIHTNMLTATAMKMKIHITMFQTN